MHDEGRRVEGTRRSEIFWVRSTHGLTPSPDKPSEFKRNFNLPQIYINKDRRNNCL